MWKRLLIFLNTLIEFDEFNFSKKISNKTRSPISLLIKNQTNRIFCNPQVKNVFQFWIKKQRAFQFSIDFYKHLL